MAADHPAAKALHPQVVQAAAVAVALTGGVQGGQAVGPLAVSRPLLQRSENGLRMHQAAGEAAEGDGVSVVDVLAHGIVRRQDFGHICTPFPLTIPPRKGGGTGSAGLRPAPLQKVYGIGSTSVK